MPKDSLSVLDAFQGKNVLISGVTGFVGKALLEKVLRSIPNVNRVYLLVRGKTSRAGVVTTPAQRVQTEILGSPIFDRLRSECASNSVDFDQYCASRLKAIRGELTEPEVGLSAEDLAELETNLDYIIHCAATVDFNERIDVAINMNVLGSQKMLAIAKRCVRMSGFIHVSTAYVNSNQKPVPGRALRIQERMYPLGFNPQDVVDAVASMSEAELQAHTMETGLGGLGAAWPNTYTFSKAIAEQLLSERRGHVPVAIVRPSIITAAWKEPVPGWIDSVMALGAAMMAIGMGLLRILPGSLDMIIGLIPVDVLNNTILSAIPYLNQQKQIMLAKGDEVSPRVMIFHSCTSGSVPPCRWRQPVVTANEYFLRHKLRRRIGDPGMTLIPSVWAYRALWFLWYQVPATLVGVVADKTGKEQHKKLAFDLNLLKRRLISIEEAFKFFVTNSWIFDAHNTQWLDSKLVPAERDLFGTSVEGINWDHYSELFAYGMATFVLKETDHPPIPAEEEFVSKVGNASVYTRSLRQRVLWDYEWFVKRKTAGVMRKAAAVRRWHERRRRNRKVRLSKL